jgi:hypothetical protein
MKTMKKLLFTATMAAWALAASAVTDILGDVNFDDRVDAKDASWMLAEYASQSTSQGTTFTDPQQKINADVDGNGVVDAVDAGLALRFYFHLSTGGEGTMEEWLATTGTGATGDGDSDAAVNKPVLTVTVDGTAGGKVFDPADAPGKQVACTIGVSGANKAYAATGFRVRYDARLALATDDFGEIDVMSGGALARLATDTPVEDPTAPTGTKGFFVASAGQTNYGLDGTMWTFSFTVPEDAAAGDVYPIDIVAGTTGTPHDLFVDMPVTAAGLDMQAYAFSKGVFSAANPNAFGTGADVAACAALAGIAGDADGYIAIADPAPVTYPLWVGGVQVCETNRTDILGDGTAWFEGTATNGTLYLSNARITEAIEHPGINTANIWSDRGFDLTISLSGSNRVECAGSTTHDYCVYAGANLAITGEGTLVAEIPNGNAGGIGGHADLRIDGATVTVSAGDTGLLFGNTLAISNATVTATGTSNYGIYCSGFNGRIDIADSVVTATGGSKGLYARGTGSSLAVSGSSVVTAVTTSDDNVAFSAAALVLGDGLAVTEPAGGVFREDGSGSGCVIDPATGGRARRVVIGPPRFAVTVEGGSTTNTTARAGETVTVVANAPEEGKAFVEWSADDAMDLSFATAAATTTTFAMPARAVTVTAVFKEIQIDSIPDQEWTGGPVEPEFRSDTVKFEGTDMVLLPGTDYTVSYTNNVDPGTATATVTMAPPRTGHASVTFQILPPPEPPAVSNVVARQRWPWNGFVDVDYEVGGDTNLLADLTVQITFAASDGRSWVATNFLVGAEPWATPGPHRATWNTAADGAANVVAEEVVATVTLVNLPYIVRFDGNGGVGGCANQKKERGETFRLNDNPFSREDFSFMAWNTAADGSGVYYTNRQEVVNIAPPGGSVTLYACWVGPDYTIKFDANGGVGDMADQTATRGVSTKLNKLAFTRENACFTGWNTKPDGTGLAIEPSGYVTNLAPYVEGSTLSFTDVATLYAQWKFVTAWFRIDFESNGGTWRSGFNIMNQDDWQWIDLNEYAKLKPVPYEREGFRFAGWNTKPDGTGVPYEDQEEVYNVSGDYDTPDLFAQWEPVDP